MEYYLKEDVTMKLTPRNYNDIINKRVKMSNNLETLEEFINSEYDCVEIEDFTQKTPAICASSFKMSIKRYHFNNIECFSRKGRVYLVKKKTK